MTFVPVVLAVLFLVLTTNAQSTPPLTYSTKVVDGDEQTCPPEEQREMARAEIKQEITDIIHNISAVLQSPHDGELVIFIFTTCS